MSKTSDLADQFVAAAADLDQLYNDLVANGSYALANQVSAAEDDLKQAATTLYATDAIDRLNDAKDVKTLTDLTAQLGAKADAIAQAEGRVAAVTGLAGTLVSLVSDLTGGNVAGAVSAAGQALGFLKQL